jgi:hypothetical protein
MAKELKLIADNWDNLYNSENDQAADRKWDHSPNKANLQCW